MAGKGGRAGVRSGGRLDSADAPAITFCTLYYLSLIHKSSKEKYISPLLNTRSLVLYKEDMHN